MTDCYIYDAIRTPRGKGKKNGTLHEVTALELATQVLNNVKDRNQLDTADVDDVVLGCVAPVGEQGANIARTSILKSTLPISVPGMHINRFCSSGLDAMNMLAYKIMAGQADMGIASGVECMSRVPILADGGALVADPSITYKHNIVPQGISADLIASLNKYSREQLDEYAVLSQTRAKNAMDKGYLKSITPIK